LQIDFPVSRIDYTMDDLSRIETSRHYLRRIESVWVYWTTLWLCFKGVIKNQLQSHLASALLKAVKQGIKAKVES